MNADLSKIIGGIYDAGLEADVWPGLLCGIADFCGLESATLVVSDNRANDSLVVSPRADPDVIDAYTRTWWKHDLTSIATAQMPAGQITDLGNTGRARFRSSTFHNEFWRRSGLGAERIATNLAVTADAFSSFVLHPSARRDEISDESRRRFAMLVPHLVRSVAVEVRLRNLQIEIAATGFQGGPSHGGLIAVDGHMRPVFADAAAEMLLCAGTGIVFSKGSIGLADRAADAQLRQAIHSCAGSSFLPFAERQIAVLSDKTSLSISVIPYRAAPERVLGLPPVALLLIAERWQIKTRSIERLKDRFGLTPAEAMLSLELMKGDGRAAAAARCGISVNTARTHLTRVFEKVGVRRQAELIRVIMTEVEVEPV